MLGIRTSASRSRRASRRDRPPRRDRGAAAGAGVSHAGSAGSCRSGRRSRSSPISRRGIGVDLAAGRRERRGACAGCPRPRSRRRAGPRGRCSRASGTPRRAPRRAGCRARRAARHSPTGSSGRYTTARSSATGEITDSRWTSSAGPFQYGTSKIADVAADERGELARAARRWSAASARCTNRSGRSQNVSPPSIVPGASIRPTVGMPAAVVQRLEDAPARRPGSACPAGAGSRRGGHEQRVEHVDEVGVAVRLGVEDVDATPSPSSVATSPSCSRRATSRSTRAEEAVGRIVEGPAERRPGRLDQHVAERRGRAVDADAELGGDHAARIRRRTSFPAVRRGR